MLVMAMALCLIVGTSASAETKRFDWDALTREATDLLSKYIQINTSNPPGNEIAAAKFIKEKFLTDGIPAVVFEPSPGRGIVAGRLRGVGHKKALILLSHIDVAPADAKQWSVPPFSGQVKNGEIWGRGALDGKGPGVIQLMAMLAIKRARMLLDRDILFIATADQEAGGKAGAGWLVEHEPGLYSDAGYVLGEDGGIQTGQAGHKYYSVAITEKSPLWLRLTASDTAGNGALPAAQTAVTRLIKALDKVDNHDAPINVLPVVEDYFRKLQSVQGGDPKLHDLRAALKDPAFEKQFVSVPGRNAMVRDTHTPTMISAGQKTNLIPSYASAELDCRLLPGDDPKAFTKVIREVIGDGNIKIEELLSFSSLASSERSELMNAIATLARRKDDDALVIPTMLAEFNDSHYFRQHRLIAYGFMPIEISDDQAHTVHAANERISIKNLNGGIERMVELLGIMGGK